MRLDVLWRRRVARRFRPVLLRPAAKVLDLCCGTGDLAFTFSPLVEQTTADTVVLDVSGQGLLFGSTSFQSLANDAEIDSTRNLSNEIVRRGNQLNLKVDVAVAVNPDVAIHAARSFKGVTVIAVGNEDLQLNALSIKKLDYALVGIEAGRAGGGVYSR